MLYVQTIETFGEKLIERGLILSSSDFLKTVTKCAL